MYLDPGSVGMFVQGCFALVAALLVSVTKPRETLAAVWRRLRGRK